MANEHGAFFSFRRIVDVRGLRCTSFFDVTSNAWKLLSVEGQNDFRDHDVIRDSSEYSCATSDTLLKWSIRFRFWREELQCADDVQYAIRNCFFPEDLLVFFGVASRHPADFDGRPTAGAQVLARVSMEPWHPYHSGPGPALHCRVPSRSESCFYLQKR